MKKLASIKTLFPALRKRAGFTLIEILVVMAIIGALVGLVGGNLITSRLRSRDAQRQSDVQQVQRALEIYYNDHGQYPDTLPAWGTVFEEGNVVYMAQLPQDPRSTQQYYYEVNSTNQKFRVYARLENTDNIVTDVDGDGIVGDDAGDVYVGKNCGTAGGCNYGLSSPNTTMGESW